MAFSLGEYQDVFLDEVDELLQELNQNLVKFEKDPEDSSIIDDIFRAAHTLKSSAAFVGLNELSELAHQMEDLFQGLRDKTMKMSSEMLNIIFQCFDEINAAISDISQGQEPKRDYTELIEEIKRISRAAKGTSASAPTPEMPSEGDKDNYKIPKTKLNSADVKMIKGSLDEGIPCYELTVFIDPTAQMKRLKEQLIIANLERSNLIIKAPDESEDLETGNVFKLILAASGTEDELIHACNVDQIIRATLRKITLDVQDGKTAVTFTFIDDFTIGVEAQSFSGASSSAPKLVKKAAEDGDNAARRKVPALKTVKVAIEKLDQLLNNVGELVIINSGFYRLYDEIFKVVQDKAIVAEFKNRMDQMSRVAKELQSGIMKTRMLPIGQVFSRFDRLVRDLTKEADKKIELVVRGEDTELDKKVIDSIGDPLLHLIRNAVDHGIESAEERAALGKPEIGTITLNAYQSGSQILVEVTDDGKGLDIEKLKVKAIDKGFSDMDSISAMSDNEIYSFIFMPGFSTAEKVTDISGRGVGMNVVKETVMELNGNVTIQTEKNVGTTFLLEFPLTLAIISAVLTKIGDELYAIPLSDIDETITIDYSDITTIEGHEVIDLRGEVLSILRLSRFIGTRSRLSKDEKMPIVIVEYANRKIGILVDSLQGKMEIVIKSLEQNYKMVQGLAGASILGDGSICLILDVATIVNMAIVDQEFQYSEKSIFDGETGSIQPAEQLEHVASESEQTEPEAADEEDDEENENAEETAYDDADAKEEDDEARDSEDLAAYDDNEYNEMQAEETDETYDETEEDLVSDDVETESDTTPDIAATEPELESEDAEVESVELSEHPETETGDENSVEERVTGALDDFRKELSQNILDNLDTGVPEDFDRPEEFSKEAIKQFQHVANIGAAHAADSLSTLLAKQVDISIPEVAVVPIEKVPSRTGCIDNVPYVGIILSVKNDTFGSILMLVNEQEAFELVDILYNSSSQKDEKVLDEYCESILKEITNIVGSAMLNVIAEKIDIVIQPNVPIFIHDSMDAIMETADVVKNSINGYVIIMDTAFFLEGDKLIGHLVFLPNGNVGKELMDALEKLNA